MLLEWFAGFHDWGKGLPVVLCLLVPFRERRLPEEKLEVLALAMLYYKSLMVARPLIVTEMKGTRTCFAV